MNRFLLVASIFAVLLGSVKAHAVELLISPGFEAPEGLPEVDGWDLEEFYPEAPWLNFNANTASRAGGPTETGDGSLWLRSFVGNGALDPNEGNFDNDNLPAGDVDGLDFLAWQRGESPNGGDPNGMADDLVVWENNYGRVGGQKANAIFSQTVPGTPNVEYTFSGYALYQLNYAGGAGTLDASSPLGAVATPTTNNFTMEFLDAGGGVLQSHTVDLVADGQANLELWQQHQVVGTAPNGTVEVRVVADAKNMVYNVDPSQSAYYDSFSLIGDDDPNEKLFNPGLDNPGFEALDFWELTETPAGCCNGEILRTPVHGTLAGAFSAHSGLSGVWLSSFYGAHPGFIAVNPTLSPVTGLMSQTAEAVPGGTYNFSGWAKFESGYSGGVDTISFAGPYQGLPSPTETWIVLEFLDPNGVVLNPIIDFDPNGVVILDPNSPNVIDVRLEREAVCPGGNANDPTCGSTGSNGNLGWTQHFLNGIVAPPGTAFARLTAGMIDGVANINPQSAFFDDFSLDGPVPLQAATGVVPEPATVVGLAVGALMLGLKRTRRRTA